MNHLSDLIELFIQSSFGSFQPRLAQVNGIGKKRTSGMNAFCIAPLLQFDPFAFKKLTQVFVKLVFLYWFHNRFC